MYVQTSKSSQPHNDDEHMGTSGVQLSENNLLAQAAQEAGVIPCLNSTSFTTSTGSINGFTTNNESVPENFAVPVMENTQASTGCDVNMQHIPENPMSLLTDTINIPNDANLTTLPLCQRDSELLSTSNNENQPKLLAAEQFTNTSTFSVSGAMHPESNQSEITELNTGKIIQDEFQTFRDNEVLPGQVDTTQEYLLITPQKIVPGDNVEAAIQDPVVTTMFNSTTPQMILPSDSE